MENSKEEEDINVRFSLVAEQLEGLRQNHLRNLDLEASQKPIHRVINDVAALSQRRLDFFNTINNAESKFSIREILKRVENIDNSIETPDRDSAISLVTAAKAALPGIHKLQKEDHQTKTLKNKELEDHKSISKQCSACVLKNGDYNFCLKNIIDHYSTLSENVETKEESQRSCRSGKDDGTQENSDFGDLTICTIRSENVMSSSPLYFK